MSANFAFGEGPPSYLEGLLLSKMQTTGSKSSAEKLTEPNTENTPKKLPQLMLSKTL